MNVSLGCIVKTTCPLAPRNAIAAPRFNVLKLTGGHGVTIGPMLLGAAAPVHVLTPSATMRRVVNMTALAVADAAALREASAAAAGTSS